MKKKEYRFKEIVELEVEGHKYIYNPNEKYLEVDGVRLKIDTYNERGVEFVGLICPLSPSTQNCRHIRRAKKDFFPYLARQAFLYYAKQNVRGGKRMSLIVQSLEGKLTLIDSCGLLVDVVNTFEKQDSQDIGKAFDEYVRELEEGRK